jgi:hypothetical protein
MGLAARRRSEVRIPQELAGFIDQPIGSLELLADVRGLRLQPALLGRPLLRGEDRNAVFIAGHLLRVRDGIRIHGRTAAGLRVAAGRAEPTQQDE